MPRPIRLLLKLLLATALLWQAGSATAAAWMGCCDGTQECCMVATLQSSCASCVPAARAETALAPPAQRLQASRVLPASADIATPEAPPGDIWRPPRRLR
jgi:hypothetical protein